MLRHCSLNSQRRSSQVTSAFFFFLSLRVVTPIKENIYEPCISCIFGQCGGEPAFLHSVCFLVCCSPFVEATVCAGITPIGPAKCVSDRGFCVSAPTGDGRDPSVLLCRLHCLWRCLHGRLSFADCPRATASARVGPPACLAAQHCVVRHIQRRGSRLSILPRWGCLVYPNCVCAALNSEPCRCLLVPAAGCAIRCQDGSCPTKRTCQCPGRRSQQAITMVEEPRAVDHGEPASSVANFARVDGLAGEGGG